MSISILSVLDPAKGRWGRGRAGLCLVLLVLLLPLALPAQEHSTGDLLPRKEGSGDTAATSGGSGGATPANPGSGGGGSSVPAGSVPAPAGQGEAGILETPLAIGLTVIGLLVGGVALLLIEIVLIPGFGVTGVMGIVLSAGAVALAYWKLNPQTALIMTVAAIAVLVLALLWAFYFFPTSRLGKAFILETTMAEATSNPGLAENLAGLMGIEGVSNSDLRPAGIARIAGQRIDVTSEGDFIPRNTPIKVVAVRGNDVIVVALRPAAASTTGTPGTKGTPVPDASPASPPASPPPPAAPNSPGGPGTPG